jgi:hypothetical protein
VRNCIAAILLFTAATVCAQPETAGPPVETSKVFGSYEVFYNVFPSAMLTEAVAAANNIVRGKNRAVINVAVRKRLPDGGDQAQAALVSGTYSDLIQSKKLEFREIKETGAIYYIAEFRHSDRELLRFDIKVQPDPNAPAHSISFTRKLYIDE